MKRIFTSIWFLALAIAIPAVIALIPVLDKYKFELVSKDKKITPTSTSYFVDLDSNGAVERVEGFGTGQSTLSFQCFSTENRLIEQYNFPHFFHRSCGRLFFADVNKNNLTEVYGFTVDNDSVFLNWVEPFDTLNQRYHSQFITTISTERRKNLDVTVKDMLFFNFDEDDEKEIVFTLNVGYNLYPRKIFVYHMDSGLLKSSELFGANFNELIPHDINSDGKLELLCSSGGAKNFPDSVKIAYKDDRPWQFVFDSNLELMYPPLSFPSGLASYINVITSSVEQEKLTILYQNYSYENTQSFITQVILPEAKFLDTIMFDVGAQKRAWIVHEDDELLIYFDRGKMYRINSDFELIDDMDLEFTSDHYWQNSIDIDGDGKNEYFISDNNKNILYAYFNDFKRRISLEFDEPIYYGNCVNFLGENQIMVTTSSYLYFYKLKVNPYYYLSYPGHLLIYLLSVWFIWLIQTIRLRQLKEKLQLQNHVRELQLKALKNQLDPHFIHNTFNTIASVIKQGRNDDAYDLFVQLSKMVRANLDSSNDIYSSILKEINFVKDYLAIQKFRFKQVFNFKVEIDKKIDMQLEIPKMLVLIHVENALKHGLMPKEKEGFLFVRLFQDKKNVIIEVEDNGIGRKKSILLKKERKGIGLSTIQQIIEINNQNKSKKIVQKIFDLTDKSGEGVGTKVVLKIER